MAKLEPNKPNVIIKVKIETEVWIGRLASLLRTVDEMDEDERRAALVFLKSKYSAQWPSDSY